ncbi:uncharacterized protein F4807DRAFT_347655 [Annulohypoxylon truncatum]|uniref:uncharacterized protein n=1 Tax=Annulohypoxylon truncatum TaxID=327061 RepID=UPI00200787F7|nr:uncharacterized protein F4807DRAFT_347655 [Annulohypoxylon truncatum]KAI1212719.1 hypothetical protein F4807DRAFT_347655 [Annulohypoxylon truncatum]
MPTFATIPCEIMISVLRELGNVRFLLPSLLTCRHVYSCFKENPGVAAEILQRQIPPDIIPYSVAVLEASYLSPRNETSVHELLETLYTQPSKFTERLRTIPVPLLTRMGHIHGVIHDLTTDFASSAWTCLHKDQGSEAAESLVLSPSEYLRFCRAFYRVELYFCLFRCRTSLTSIPFHEHRFFSNQPPWEKEQLASALDFLELKLSRASRDVVAHDVEFGELKIDYITTGMNNYMRQLWLSQGVDFIHRLMSESSYDGKKALLKSAFAADRVDLYEALMTPPETDLNDDVPLSSYTNEDLAALFPPTESQDTDEGPLAGWRVAFNPWPRSAWVMLAHLSALRERAYVFWDLDRIEIYRMRALFNDAPANSELQRAYHDLDEMRESFEERSRIWQKGGSGYWSKNDESRIVWPTQQDGN